MTGDDLLPYITRGPAILILVFGLLSLLVGLFTTAVVLRLRIVTDRLLPVFAHPKNRVALFLLILAIGIPLAIAAQFATWARLMTAVQLADTLNHAGRPGVKYYLSVMNGPPDAVTLLAKRHDQTVASVQVKQADLQAVITAINTGSITGVDPAFVAVMEGK
jgi:hypothetical protein